MSTLNARVVNGRLHLDEPVDLPDGTVIDHVTPNEGDQRDLDDDERKALHAALAPAWRVVQHGMPGIPPGA